MADSPDESSAEAVSDPPLGPVSAILTGTEAADALRQVRRRADIDARQEKLGKLLEEMGCEGVILLVPAHVNWFTGGMHVRGLIAESERPGIYTNGRQRWLLCSVTDTQRLFDEELDGLGFQVKEWQWASGRAVLLAELVAGKKFAVDRPFPNMPQVNEKLRFEIRGLSQWEQGEYIRFGKHLANAVEATARTMPHGATEEEVAGQLAHRLYRRGIELVAASAVAEDRGGKYRRAGFSRTVVSQACTIQATGSRNGLFCTASRTVCFNKCPEPLRLEFDAACKVSAVYRSLSVAGQTVGHAAEAGWKLLAGTPHEYEGRLSQPGFGTGRVAAEELRRAGHEEKFVPGWALVWQARVGSAAVVDTLMIADGPPVPITPPDGWPYKRITVKGQTFDVPDLLVRE